MEYLLTVLVVFTTALFAILAFIVVRDKRDKQELEYDINQHPENRANSINLKER